MENFSFTKKGLILRFSSFFSKDPTGEIFTNWVEDVHQVIV